MPIYEYECRSCAARFEVKQRFSDPALTVHDACGGELRKVFQPAPIVFKGSGWYITDSRPKPKEESSSGSGARSEPSAPAKSEKAA